MGYNLITLACLCALFLHLFIGTMAFSVLIRIGYEPLLNKKGLFVATFGWPILVLCVVKRNLGERE